MPAIDERKVREIAWLARLELPAEAIARYAAELSRILVLADALRRAPVEGLAPLAHPLEDLPEAAPGALREDAVTESDQRERHRNLTPHRHGDLYLVPPVIE